MSTSPNESPSNSAATPPKPRDISYAVIACLFIFMGIDSLIDHAWIDGGGWLAMTLGLFVLIVSKPMTEENWNQPRYLLCLVLVTVGISLLLCSPGRHRERTSTLSHPAETAVSAPAKP